MKRLILAAGLVMGVVTVGTAQTGRSSRDSATVYSEGTSHPTTLPGKKVKKVKKTPKGKKVVTKKVPLRQDRIYHWKNGQRATPTGNEATGINATRAVQDTTRKKRE